MPFRPIVLYLAGITAFGVFAVLRLHRNRNHEKELHAVTRSPLTTILPRLRPEEIARLAYGPKYFPGARDVSTPYGTSRAYEFGPEEGPKVLLVHGISTPCLSLGGLAHELVKRGCRVILYGKNQSLIGAFASGLIQDRSFRSGILR
jgi:hypothetical protein